MSDGIFCEVLDSRSQSDYDKNRTGMRVANLRIRELEAENEQLLTALEELFNLLEENQGNALWYLRKHYNTAKAAIAKARGEEQALDGRASNFLTEQAVNEAIGLEEQPQ